MKPKVVISNYDDINNPYYAGGGARAIHAVAKRLTKKFNLTILTGMYPNAKNETVDCVEYKRIGLSNFGPRVGQFLFHFYLQYYIRSMEFNLWIESFTPPISTSFLPLGTSRPVVGLVHMLSGDDMERKYHLPFSIIENIGLKFYKNYVVLTDVSKAKVILANPRANVYVIPNGVDTIQNARDKICKTGVKHLLFMGRIEFNQKGLDLLIGAFSRISQNSDLDLQIAGTGSSEDLKQLENLLDKKRIRDRVRVLGRIEGRKKSDYFKNSFAIVIPSRYETFSLTALEAMSFGKPIVCFDIDGMRWLPPSCAVKVKAFDEGDYASQIMRLRQDDNARKKIARSQREEIKKYSWGQVAKRYGDVISDFLNNNAANN